MVLTEETVVFKMFSKTFFDDPFESFIIALSKLMGLAGGLRRWFVSLDEHTKSDGWQAHFMH